MPNKKQKPVNIKLRNLKITNFKSLESFEIEFPSPRMKNDPDIFVMGSTNGLGKTSILECCSLLFLAAEVKEEVFRRTELPVDLYDLLIKAGADMCVIEGNLEIKDKLVKITLTIKRSNTFHINKIGDIKPLSDEIKHSQFSMQKGADRFLSSLVGFSMEPLCLPRLMYFHSYRKVQEGNPDLGMIVKREVPRQLSLFSPRYNYSMSTFKLEILRALMSRADLFENLDYEESNEVVVKLNELVQRYAGGSIEKLRPSTDNTVDFRISPLSGGESFTFDGLSSGQKEIISTLFLIWLYTKHAPSIVLIDEPELHLNVEWHRDFLRHVSKLAPQNQYIVATHSEDIFGSVSEDRRILLQYAQGPTG